MKAIIPTGGRGTRMRPLTFSANKHFIPIANKPLIYYPIEAVAQAGIKEVGITYNPGGLDEAKAFLEDGARWGLNISYILQEKPMGLANIAEVCEEFIDGDSFVLHLGDNIFLDGIKKAVEYFEEKKPDGLVTMIHHKENTRMGVPYFDEFGKLQKYVEKPENPPHDFAIPGLYFANSNFFKCFKGADPLQPSARGEYEIPDAYQWLIDHGFNVEVMEYKGKWLDPGKFDDWILSNQFILDAKLKPQMESEVGEDCLLENRIKIGIGCSITTSHIRGPVVIGNNVTIKDSYIGPFTSVSNDCQIEGSHIENSVIMNKVVIKNISQPIDTSIVGLECEISKHNGPTSSLKLFIGEKSKIEV